MLPKIKSIKSLYGLNESLLHAVDSDGKQKATVMLSAGTLMSLSHNDLNGVIESKIQQPFSLWFEERLYANSPGWDLERFGWFHVSIWHITVRVGCQTATKKIVVFGWSVFCIAQAVHKAFKAYWTVISQAWKILYASK